MRAIRTARESLRRDRPGGLTSPACHTCGSASPFHCSLQLLCLMHNVNVSSRAAQRPGAAARESQRRGRPGGHTSPALHACGSASPFHCSLQLLCLMHNVYVSARAAQRTGTPARPPWRAHVACVPRLRQRQSFERMLFSHYACLYVSVLLCVCMRS